MNRKKTDLDLNHTFYYFLSRLREQTGLVVMLGISFVILATATYFSFVEMNGFRQLSLVDFEIGRVADRDVIASRDITYVDENATRIRRDARQRLVPAVFRYDRELSTLILREYTDFVNYLETTMHTSSGPQEFVLQVQQQYPGILDKKQMLSLYGGADRIGILSVSENIFKQIINEGIAAFPDEGMEKFNQSDVELVRWNKDRQERTAVPKESLLTWSYLRTYTFNALQLMKKPVSMTDTIISLVKPFLKENLIYQADESEAKLQDAIKQVSPVQVVIQKGQKIIKRGFIITEDAYAQMEELSRSGVYIDVRQFIGTILFLIILLFVSIYLFASGIDSLRLQYRNVVMLLLAFCFMYLLVLTVSRLQPFALQIDFCVILPAALVTMLIAVLVDQVSAILMSFILALGVLCASNFALAPSLFTLFSGLAGVSVMRITGKRIDLVKSACILAMINPVIIAILIIILPGSTTESFYALIGAAVNGFMSGILVLGFLPILESALNTSTNFRLMEFSDLNSPIMKRMLLSVSGTYSHSIMVATLAESACREIGANSLLARVGAYYHDIGKMDQSEYFVENQTDYNKHLDLNPRLSATVIRSHVKQGVEKARQMRLPREVIDIIFEHHGNSIISYFYNEAKKHNDTVDPEDFMYPGNPPRSKESAVVMLADIVEAACRTLDKPSVPRLEKFISELIEKKIETNQLDDSDLTFREVGIIKKTFVSILAGYYHSRIEYPNQRDPDSSDSVVKESILRGKKT